ncbi:MAG: acyl-CoA desaturase [Bacteroidetes bacterium]|nr:acyl-CoA desaturase [Bacteroidota bacterium]
MGNSKKQNRIEQGRTEYNTKSIVVFVFLHLLPIAAFWLEVHWSAWVICAALYFIRMFFITGFYHRFFAHRSFKTSRWFQFVIAWLAQTSMQKGALWWAGNHRTHHRHSDHEHDPHSNKLFGFIYSHLGWIMSSKYKETKFNVMGDFAKYKELRWLNKNHLLPPMTLLLAVFLYGGLVIGDGSINDFLMYGSSTALIGFMLSTIILYHGTYSINSLMHMIGTKRYETDDESKNSLILALITLGEGWHNNHHHFMTSTRQGFFWWEIDITFYLLKFLSFFGLIWDLVPVPDKVKYSFKEKVTA